MFSNIRISVRLAIGIALTLLVVVLVMLPAVLGQLGNVSARAEARQLDELHATLQASVRDASASALVTITSVVNAKGVTEAFANRDRAQLQALTSPVFDALKKNYNISQFQFHLSPATSFLRLHDLAKFGDDLSGFRATVVKTNELVQAQSGLESGVAGIGLRGVIPVSHEGRHVGSAEIGVTFGQGFFDSFSSQFKAPAALHIRPASDFKIFATTIPGKTTLSPEQIAAALGGQVITAQVKIDGQDWSVMAKSVPDFSGKPIAVAEILIDRSYYATSYRNTLLQILGIGLVSLLVGLALAWQLSRSITKPIELLTHAAAEISRGKIEEKIAGTERKDEIGDLARALERMSASIKIAMDRIRKLSAS
ncbi:MAG: cache domain-containing protein [Rhodocyclaceae bacterium]|jgi:methyl-accepting chemotaxis protein|nr:cache domain-containing protein [Rhodocyclaceae bacterium]